MNNITKHINQNRSFINQILITLVIGGLIHFLNYLFNIYLARNLDSNNFSFYNAALGIVTLIQIPTIAIQTAVTKKVASRKNFNLNQFKKRSTLQLTLIATVISLLFLIFGKHIADIANIPIDQIPTLTFVVFISIVSPIAKGFLLGLERILSFNMVLLAETVIKFAIGYIALQLASDMNIIILAFSIPLLMSTLIVLPLIKTGSSKRLKKPLALNYKQISLIFVTFLLLNVPFTVDLILVNHDVRASYGALSLIGKIVYFASVTIANIMVSKLSNSEKELRKKNLLISLLFSTAVGVSICLIYFLFTQRIVDIVFSGMYMDIVRYVVPYSIAMILYAISYMIITSELVNDSYIHIVILAVVSILQVVLYNINNRNLNDAFINQVIVYGVLFIFVLAILIFKTFKLNGSKKNI